MDDPKTHHNSVADTPWQMLADEYGFELVAEVRREIKAHDFAELDPDRIARAKQVSTEQVLALLLRLSTLGDVDCAKSFVCPNCSYNFSADALQFGECPNCERRFAELDSPPTELDRFLIPGDPRRSISWAIAVHGMNTTGTWQEELSWRIATKYKYSAPIAIYKYGIVRPGVLLRWRHRQLMRQLGNRMKELMDQAKKEGFSDRPDIIAHSFGTLLIGQLLTCGEDEYRNLRFGRIILAGSILRPNYDWNGLVSVGRVEAVLNHYGTSDLPVLLSHHFIPDSGPSGRIGFSLPGVINVPAKDWGHSSFFTRRNLRTLLDHGLWNEFLTQPFSKLNELVPNECANPTWIPSWTLFRLAPRYLAIVVLTVLLVGAVSLWVLGLWVLFSTR